MASVVIFKNPAKFKCLMVTDIHSGPTLCVCNVCKERKENCTRYNLGPYACHSKMYLTARDLDVNKMWICSEECVNMYILRYLL